MAVVLTLAVVLPPFESYARQYAFLQALQFVLFATVVPALLALSAPWRDRLARPASGGKGNRAEDHMTGGVPTADRYVAAKLLVFMALVIVWRLPLAGSALARYPVLVAGEMVTLVAAGSGIWVEMAARQNERRLARPKLAAIAAVAMWTIWIVAYVTGMSHSSLSLVGGHAATTAFSVAVDQQLAVAVMWGVPAICFMPLIYGMLITWLGEREDPDQELREIASHDSSYAGAGRLHRPPRGWRLPPT